MVYFSEYYGASKAIYYSFCKWRDNSILYTLNPEVDYENRSIESSTIKIY